MGIFNENWPGKRYDGNGKGLGIKIDPYSCSNLNAEGI